MPHDQAFLDQVVALIRERVEHGGHVFGVVSVRSGKALAQVLTKPLDEQKLAVAPRPYADRVTLYGRWSSPHGQ